VQIITVVAARRQFIKLAPIDELFRGVVDHLIVHNGQHYDHVMSESFFQDLNISKPALNLESGSASHAEQTARMMPGLEKFLLERKPDWGLLYGDTNSTVTGAVVASEMGIRVAHLETELRSGNRAMPAEINRFDGKGLLNKEIPVALARLETKR